MLVGDLLQSLLQPLPRPFAALGGNFTFDVGKTGDLFRVRFHGLTRVAFLVACAG
jgi:hypothetical protein